jgi:glycosyltransferase involved in cell wall biosynthesis
MNNPRVSVGLPVYNGERFLAAAIDSILAQDFEDFELLIGDNASSDRTLEIAEAAAANDARVKIYRSESNRGAAWNYNRLVELARGEYFKWAAHDDLHEPAFLGRCVEVLDANPDVVLCYSQTGDIDEESRLIRRHDRPAYATDASPSQRARHVVMVQSWCFETFGLMRRRDLVRTRKIGPYADSDNVMLLELALLGRFQEISEMLFLHREHAGRSMYCYRDPHARNIWFDSSRSGKFTAPNWRRLGEYARATMTAPIPVSERLKTFKYVLSWAKWHRGLLWADVVAVATGHARASAPSSDDVVNKRDWYGRGAPADMDGRHSDSAGTDIPREEGSREAKRNSGGAF